MFQEANSSDGREWGDHDVELEGQGGQEEEEENQDHHHPSPR